MADPGAHRHGPVKCRSRKVWIVPAGGSGKPEFWRQGDQKSYRSRGCASV